MGNTAVALRCTDKHKCLVIFEQANYDKHKRYHPELRQEDFFPTRVKEALQRPTFTIQGNLKHSMCYYLEEYSSGGIMLYTKVVLHEGHRHAKNNPHCTIKTAFRTSVIKETSYGYKKMYD